MGATVSASPLLYKSKTTPDYTNPPTFDPNYGFEGQRKERGIGIRAIIMKKKQKLNL